VPNGLRALPVFYAATIAINVFSIMYTGAPGEQAVCSQRHGWEVSCSCGVAFIVYNSVPPVCSWVAVNTALLLLSLGANQGRTKL